MILGIEKELAIFLQAVLSGNQICLMYDILRVFRRLVKHNLLCVSIEDILFWIGTGFYLFVRIYETSNGTIRWYFVLGVLFGGFATYYIIEKLAKKYIAKFRKK